jgi:hypothetical protein
MSARRYRADVLTRLEPPEPKRSQYKLVDVGGGLMLPDWTVRLFAPETGRTPPRDRTDDLPF